MKTVAGKVRLNWRAGLACLLLIPLCLLASPRAFSRTSLEITDTTAVSPKSNHASSKPTPPPHTSAAGAQVAVTDQAPTIVASPMCNRSTAYAPPAAMPVSIDQPGLHQTMQQPVSYPVYGNSLPEINNQISSCTPVSQTEGDSHFAASTDYSINWVFSYRSREDGLCVISQASVGLNISQVYPSWHASIGSPASLASSWHNFINNLAVHENGHAQLDQASAAQLYNDLINFPATECGTIASAATAKANADMAALNQANANYDSATGHGSAQGAVLK